MAFVYYFINLELKIIAKYFSKSLVFIDVHGFLFFAYKDIFLTKFRLMALKLPYLIENHNTKYLIMKNLLLSAMMLTGVVTFAQETPKKPANEATQTTTTTVNADKKTEVSKTTEVKADKNGDKKVETTTTTKTTDPAQPAAPATKTTTTVKKEK